MTTTVTTDGNRYAGNRKTAGANNTNRTDKTADDVATKRSADTPSQGASTKSTTGRQSKVIRMVLMLLFLIVFGFVEAVLWITTLVCFVTHVFQDKPLPQAVSFGQTLGRYARDIVSFLTYNRETPPWPFEPLGNREEK